jgi:hypothetical protein
MIIQLISLLIIYGLGLIIIDYVISKDKKQIFRLYSILTLLSTSIFFSILYVLRNT